MHQEGPGLCHYCSSSGLAGVWESGLFLMFHTSKGNSTDRTFFVFNKDYVASGFSCWGCIINMGLERNSEWAFIENHIPNFSLWLQRSLLWSRKSNISKYPEKNRVSLTDWVCWLTASSAHSPKACWGCGWLHHAGTWGWGRTVLLCLLERLGACQTGCQACPNHVGEIWEQNLTALRASPCALSQQCTSWVVSICTGKKRAPRCHRLKISYRILPCSPLSVVSANLKGCECDLNLKQMQLSRNWDFLTGGTPCPRCVQYFRRLLDFLAALQRRAVKTT